MQEILDAPDKKSKSENYAGFWIRFVAYIVDTILLWIVQVLLAFIIFGDYSFIEPNFELTLISLCVGIAYFAGLESSSRQGTLGKMLLKLKVGDANGAQISFANALGRYLAKIPSALILGIGFFMAGWDPRKQALHDKIADTYVYES